MAQNALLHSTMHENVISLDDLVKSLADNFNVLADEVQLLSDRKTILEHKLRFAHEQYQHLADKYAPSDPEISATVAKLQLPPELKLNPPDSANFVPLPSRKLSGSKQQTAEAIRDGRRASKKLATLRGWQTLSDSGSRSISGTSDSIVRTSRVGTSATSIFEQDFTVPGRKSELLCPLAKMANRSKIFSIAEASPSMSDPTSVHQHDIGVVVTPIHASPADPICAALYSESHPSPPPSANGSAVKCPIRFLDQHSPEEVARYFESHKHEIPRSHEVCVKRYQRNEEDIRKLDAKYGNLVSMISGLGQKHQPMLQVKEDDFVDFSDKKSIERVQNWANTVGVDNPIENNAAVSSVQVGGDREGRFDRPLKEIRVGESPSRPWGISVPYIEQPTASEKAPKSPELLLQPSRPVTRLQGPENARKCSFDHGQKPDNMEKPQEAKPADGGARPQPTFIQHSDLSNLAGGGGPQMVFTGPVFIGYSIDQAMVLMRQWQMGDTASSENKFTKNAFGE